MFGGVAPVRATIMVSDAYSAHADRAEILHWLGGFKHPPGITYIVHGEPEAAAALREAVVGTLGWRAEVARDGQRVTV
jgi:metallo-beta-lactamase family protein